MVLCRFVEGRGVVEVEDRCRLEDKTTKFFQMGDWCALPATKIISHQLSEGKKVPFSLAGYFSIIFLL